MNSRNVESDLKNKNNLCRFDEEDDNFQESRRNIGISRMKLRILAVKLMISIKTGLSEKEKERARSLCFYG